MATSTTRHVPKNAPKDRATLRFLSLLQATAVDKAQILSITNRNPKPVTVSYSVDLGKTWKAVAANPKVGVNATRSFDMRGILGTMSQGPIYIRYKFQTGQTFNVANGWYYEPANPPLKKAMYVFSRKNGDAGPTYTKV